MDQLPVKPNDDRLRLPVGTLLGGDIRIEGELGAGGFGITYRARDEKLGRALAVKEYFPVDIGNRDSTMSVQPVTSSQGKVFHWGLDKFIQEAKMLAALDHPGIVRVLRYFEENQTAYMILDFVEGKSMSRWLEGLGGPPSQADLDRITDALCAALAVIHDKGIVHRDIAPDNIIIRPDGMPVLLDFGAARQDLAEHSRVHTRTEHSTSFAIVKNHYSPFEQRSTDKRNRGPWSDVYSLGATLYRAMTGKPPADAMDRVDIAQDPVRPVAEVAKARYRPSMLQAVDSALAFRRSDRPQTIAAFRALAFAAEAPLPQPGALGGEPPERRPKVSTVSEFDRWSPQGQDKSGEARSSSARRPPIAALTLLLLAMLAGAAYWFAVPRERGAADGPGSKSGNVAGSVTVDPPTPSPPRDRQPQPVPSLFATERSAMEQMLQSLRAELGAARRAGGEGSWDRQRAQAEAALRLVDACRSQASRLRSAAVADSERRAVDDYLAEVSTLERQASDLRQDALDRARRDAEQREIARPPREAQPPPSPPPPMAAMVRRTNVFMKNPLNKDDGYRIIAGETVGGCEAQCLSDQRCRAMELHKPTRKCNLYDTYQIVPDRGSQSEVAEKLVDGRLLGPLAVSTQGVPAPPPPREESGETLWLHNGSTMRLVSRGEQRSFFYVQPRAGLQAVGVTPGTLLFNGARTGSSYQGTARIFAKGCPPATYQVAGTVAQNDRRIELRGQRPRVNEQNCRITGYAEDVLIFDFIER